MSTEEREIIGETINYSDFVEMESVREFRARVSTTTTILTGGMELGAMERIMFAGETDIDNDGNNATVLEYPDGSVRIQPDATALYELDAEQRVR